MISNRALPKAAALLCFALTGCTSVIGAFEGNYEPPVIAPISPTNASLRQLPPPKNRVAVAVYDFQDMTGQLQESENFQQLSNSVTQGGALVLIKALHDAGERRWFKVLERNRLSDLLNERQIITETRRVYRGEDQINPAALPPLDHAAIIIEGGIIGYNTNLRDGGFGARYLGIGANVQHTRDEITVALRAVSTKSGEVLHAVSARKSVYSVLLQSGVFRFAKLNELLEVEAGIVDNEPRQIAVEAAIEKAVQALIIEGAELGIWKFQDPKAARDTIAAYRSQAESGQAFAAAAPPDTRNAARITRTVPWRKPAAPVPAAVVKSIKRLPPPKQENEAPLG